jgi:hypothetical protein
MRWIAFILLFFTFAETYSQVRPDNHERLYPTLLDKGSHVTEAQVEKVRTLFSTIQEDIVAGKVNKFSHHFDRQIFLNITRGESGYFSSDQAASLLQHYMETRKIVSFEFSRLNDKGLTPYATGRLVSIYKGSLESAQVYVSCSWQATGWVIGQFNIY